MQLQELAEQDKMSNNNLIYTTINVSDITPSILNDCLETNIHTLTTSVDGTQAILKWKGDTPAWIATLGLTTYTQTQIRALCKTAAWMPSGPTG
tara:strand:- start:265 stop:546 length:282 start_codon:yes stop_codon:yes gene_type:complete